MPSVIPYVIAKFKHSVWIVHVSQILIAFFQLPVPKNMPSSSSLHFASDVSHVAIGPRNSVMC